MSSSSHRNERVEHNKTVEQNEEASLLASIGGELRDQTNYETQVLREATSSSAPLLNGIGFPDLSPLAPSYEEHSNTTTRKRRRVNNHGNSNTIASSDVPHIVKVLNQVRRELEQVNNSKSVSMMEGRQAQILRIKYQMLLTYLASQGVPKEEAGISGSSISEEVSQEQRRKEYLNRNAKKEMKVKSIDGVRESLDRNSRGRRVSLQATKDGANRLEQIKRGEVIIDETNDEDEVSIVSKSATASFGKQALAARNASIAVAKYKQSSKKLNMMSLKQKLVEESGAKWVDPEELYQKRMERRERRRKRRLERFGISTDVIDMEDKKKESEGNDASNAHESAATIRSEGMQKETKQNNTHRPVQIGQTGGGEREVAFIPDEEIAVLSAPPKSVHCDLCGQNITIPDDFVDGADAFLSQHMSSCIDTVRPTRRSRKAVSRQISYKEVDDMDEVDFVHRKANSSTNIERKDTKRKKIDSSFVIDDDIGDDESSEDEVVQISNNESDEKLHSYKNSALDDYKEEDYEDRVDEWVESGISNMREMKEQDENEERPGAVSFQDGLNIPAWINDRLFGYQRTALRWLWELHLQQAGGVVGDEMGMYFTSDITFNHMILVSVIF